MIIVRWIDHPGTRARCVAEAGLEKIFRLQWGHCERRPSKYRSRIFLAVAVLILAMLPVAWSVRPAEAQSGGGYDLTWSVIAGGGGTLLGGAYSLGATSGQAAVGTLSGGAYIAQDGFWFGVQPPAAATPTGTRTATPTATRTATFTSSPTATPTNTPSATPTRTSTSTATAIPTATSASSPTVTQTRTPSATATATPTSTPTTTPLTATTTPTATSSSTPTSSQTQAPTNTATHTSTATPTGLVVATLTQTPTQTPTTTLLQSATPTPTVTPEPTSTAPRCIGDCNGDGKVTEDETITLAAIALGNAQPSACPDGLTGIPVTTAQILTAVNNALNRCPGN